MRVLGYSKKWDKLQKTQHTTFRFTRKDRDWALKEMVQEVYHPRSSKDREIVNRMSRIDGIQSLWVKDITDAEAVEDGFKDAVDMLAWLVAAHGSERCQKEQIHKLSITVISVK